jgi:hypothetical protein
VNEIVTSLTDQVSPALNQLQSAVQKRDDIEERLANARARIQESQAVLATLPATVPVERTTANSPLAQQLEEQLAKIEPYGPGIIMTLFVIGIVAPQLSPIYWVINLVYDDVLDLLV